MSEPVKWAGQNTFCKNCHRIPSQCCCTPAKTLTNEEIAEEWAKFYPDVFHTHLIDFAKAILRKAQEK
jgi:hypothetical protein